MLCFYGVLHYQGLANHRRRDVLKACWVLLGCAVLALVSCTSYQLVPESSDGNTIRYNRGNRVLLASDERVTVAASAQTYRNSIYFSFIVKNHSAEVIHVDDSNASLVEQTTGRALKT